MGRVPEAETRPDPDSGRSPAFPRSRELPDNPPNPGQCGGQTRPLAAPGAPAPVLQEKVTKERPRGQVEKMLWTAGLLR